MFATVPMRCMSFADGSASSGSRCMRMPTWRWSRTACWAAATDLVRPSVIGSTSPGNSTVERTGTMIKASAGNGGNAPPDASLASWASFACNSISATIGPCFLQRDHQTSSDGGTIDAAVAAGRQPYPAIEPPLRQFEPVDRCGTQFRRQNPHAGNNKLALLDNHLGVLDGDAGQRHQHQHLAVILEDVDRRLPYGLPRLRCPRPEHLAMHALGAREHVARFRPHPIAGQISGHEKSPFKLDEIMCGAAIRNSTPAGPGGKQPSGPDDPLIDRRQKRASRLRPPWRACPQARVFWMGGQPARCGRR